MTSVDGRRREVAGVGFAPSTHAGLWLDKALPVLHPELDEEKDALRKLLETVCGTHVPDGYREAVKQREDLLRGLDGGIEGGITRVWKAAVLGRMIVGLGAQSVRETSIALQHTWGVPQIPGSALKGLAASVAHRRGGETWCKGTEHAPGGRDHETLFGTTESAGCVVFHDAWWLPGSEGSLPIDLDVMTVHHTEYYGKGKAIPADWDEPIPVPFLTAFGEYLVALSGPPEWVSSAFGWLEIGLADDGIGAKTQAGYGRAVLAARLSEREQRDEKTLASLRDLPSQHRGASTAATSVQRLLQAKRDGVDPGRVQDVARSLFEKDPQFWKGWRTESSRTDDDRTLMAFASADKAAAVVVQVTAPAMPSLAWVAAEAWRTKIKGRDVVIARISGKELEPREFRLLRTGEIAVDEQVERLLTNTSPELPAHVEVQVKGKGKLEGLRPKEA